MQSLLPAIYPVLQQNYALSFTQIGLHHFAFQVTASLLQPAVGFYTDRRPLLPALLARHGRRASSACCSSPTPTHYCGAAGRRRCCVGIGSSVFHPEASRVARLASGGRYGFAQSLFQVGGNTGSAVGPLLAAFIVLPFGQPSIAWFSVLALSGMVVLWNVGTWARAQYNASRKARDRSRRRSRACRRGAGDRRSAVLAAAGLLQVLLPGEPHELLHVLPDREVRRLGAAVAAAPLPLPRARWRSGTLRRRAGRRPDRPQGGDLGLDPRRPAVHAGAALRQPLLDGGADGGHRPRHRLGLLGDHRLRPGAGAGAGRHGRRAVLRLRLRHGGSARPLLGVLADGRASASSTRSARSCRCSGFSRSSCRRSEASPEEPEPRRRRETCRTRTVRPWRRPRPDQPYLRSWALSPSTLPPCASSIAPISARSLASIETPSMTRLTTLGCRCAR